MFRLNLFGAFGLTHSNGEDIRVKSRKAKALLAVLARPVGTRRSRDTIIALLWSDRSEDQARGSLRQVLSGLRKELGDGVDDLLSITADDLALNPENVTVSDANGEEFMAGFHINDPAFDDWLRDERSVDQNANSSSGPSDPIFKRELSLAVLPFANLSGDPDQVYFSDGITEDIITELNRHRALFVIASRTSFTFRGEDADPLQVGEKLGVGYVVSGSVRKAGNRVRISAQLIDTGTSAHLWSEKFDRELTDIFALQDEIAATVSSMVSGHVDIAYSHISARKHPADVDAYDLVCRSDWYTYRNFADEHVQELLMQAIKIDPEYGQAHARLALNTAYKLYSECARLEDIEDTIVMHAEKAARNGSQNAIVHANLAECYALIGRFQLARHHFDCSVALNPNDMMVQGFGAETMALLGEHDVALRMIERALRHNPYDTMAFREMYFDIYYMSRHFEKALAQFDGWPDHPFYMYISKAAALAMLDRMDEAHRAIEYFNSNVPKEWDVAELIRSFQLSFARQPDKDLYVEGLTKAGLKW